MKKEKKERTDKKYKYGESMRWILRKPVTSSERLAAREKIDKAFYEYTKPTTAALNKNREPSYSDEYLDLMVPIDELEDIKKQLNVSPMVRIKKPDLRKGLPNILLAPNRPADLVADVSNKPPTLEDYLRLGITISQLSEEERKTVQQMLDATLYRKEEK